MQKILMYSIALFLLVCFSIIAWTYERKMNYKLSYEDMVVETVRQELNKRGIK